MAISSDSCDYGRFDELAEEFAQRYRRGERPSLQEFVDRLPKMADEIRAMFPALIEIEQVERVVRDQARGLSELAPRLRQVGDYRIVREVGRGGMGVVYEAEQISLGRRVALKVLRGEVVGDRRALARFRREAKAAARLHHTNIVPVFEVGRDGDVAYYAMQFIQGQALDQVIDEVARLRSHKGQPPGENPSRWERLSSPGPVRPHNRELAYVAESLVAGRLGTEVGSSFAGTARAPTEAVGREPVDVASSSEARSLEATQPGVGRVPIEDESSSAVLPGGTEVSRVDSSARRPSFYRSVAQIGLQISQALGYAHARGVVHRDIKPSNLLLDSTGVVWITDFGLAKSEEDGLTQTGDVLGTVRYMAPERFRGEADARADTYALGLTLYELLTLKPAYPSNDRLELMESIKTEDPARPRSLDAGIPRDLETIVLKAIDKAPTRRYATAEAMAEDLRRFLADEPIKARRVSPAERLWRLCRRNPAAAVLAAAVVLSLITGTATSSFLAVQSSSFARQARMREKQAQRERINATASARRERRERDRADAQTRSARRQLYQAHMNLSQHYWEEGQAGLVVDLLKQHEPRAGELDLRGWEWYYQQRLCQDDLRTLTGHTSGVLSVAFSPDGRRLVSSGMDQTIKVWDTVSGRELRTLKGHSGWVNGVALRPDGQRLASAGADQTIRLRDAVSGEELRTLEGHTDLVHGVAYSPDGQRLASASGDRTVKVGDAGTGREIHTLRGHTLTVYNVAYSPDGRRLASASMDGTVRLWDAVGGRELCSIQGHIGPVIQAVFSPDGELLATAGFDQTARLWDAASGQELRTLRGHTHWVLSVAFSPDGRRLVSAGADQRVKLWDAAGGNLLGTLQGHTNRVQSAAFSPDGECLATASLDRSVRVWDAGLGHEYGVVAGDRTAVRSVVFSRNGQELACARGDGTVKMFDMLTIQEQQTLKGHTDVVSSVAYSRDRSYLASGSYDRTVRVWDPARGQELRTLRGHAGAVWSVAFRPDGQCLASAGEDRTVKVWDAANGQVLRTLEGHADSVPRVVFSPDGQRIASASHDQTVRVWDAASGQVLRVLRGHTDMVLSVAFRPDGQRLASASADQTVKVWDTASGEELRTLKGHTNFVDGVAFSPDGQRLASAGYDQTVRVWDPVSGQVLRTLKGHTHGVLCVAFSPDGQCLVSCADDLTVRVWNAQPWTSQLLLEREAFGRLDSLFARPLRRNDVLDYLRSAPTIPPQVRAASLLLAEHHPEETDPKLYHAAAWPVVRHPYANPFVSRFAHA